MYKEEDRSVKFWGKKTPTKEIMRDFHNTGATRNGFEVQIHFTSFKKTNIVIYLT